MSGNKEYKKDILIEDNDNLIPYNLFEKWFEEAKNTKIESYNAMILATTDYYGQPSARIVLLKKYSKEGFTFFTNYNSKKGNQIAKNNKAALLFFWAELERQIRIEGKIFKTSRKQSENYFNNRNKGSKISAIVSKQSQIIESRTKLDENITLFTKNNTKEELNCPDYWGGYILKPNLFEFWQGRENRLNDRLQYHLSENNWIRKRLQP